MALIHGVRSALSTCVRLPCLAHDAAGVHGSWRRARPVCTTRVQSVSVQTEDSLPTDQSVPGAAFDGLFNAAVMVEMDSAAVLTTARGHPGAGGLPGGGTRHGGRRQQARRRCEAAAAGAAATDASYGNPRHTCCRCVRWWGDEASGGVTRCRDGNRACM